MKLIAKKLSERLDLALVYALKTVKDRRQAFSTSQERRALKNKFVSTSPLPERIVLIDDVYTTGSTVKDSVSALHASNAKEVLVYVLAKV